MGTLVDGVWQGGDDRRIGAEGWELRNEVVASADATGRTRSPRMIASRCRPAVHSTGACDND